jgi:hypothetical protein
MRKSPLNTPVPAKACVEKYLRAQPFRRAFWPNPAGLYLDATTFR